MTFDLFRLVTSFPLWICLRKIQAEKWIPGNCLARENISSLLSLGLLHQDVPRFVYIKSQSNKAEPCYIYQLFDNFSEFFSFNVSIWLQVLFSLINISVITFSFSLTSDYCYSLLKSLNIFHFRLICRAMSSSVMPWNPRELTALPVSPSMIRLLWMLGVRTRKPMERFVPIKLAFSILD